MEAGVLAHRGRKQTRTQLRLQRLAERVVLRESERRNELAEPERLTRNGETSRCPMDERTRRITVHTPTEKENGNDPRNDEDRELRAVHRDLLHQGRRKARVARFQGRDRFPRPRRGRPRLGSLRLGRSWLEELRL